MTARAVGADHSDQEENMGVRRALAGWLLFVGPLCAGGAGCDDTLSPEHRARLEKMQAENERRSKEIAAENEERKAMAAKSAAMREERVRQEVAVRALPSDEKAKRMIETLDDSGRDLFERLQAARALWAMIPSTDRSRPLVRKASALFDRREKEQQREQQRQARQEAKEAKERARTEEQAAIPGREAFATLTDHNLIESGIEGSARATGSGKTTLRIDSFICGRVFVSKSFGATVQATMRELGFKRLACSNSFSTTTLDL